MKYRPQRASLAEAMEECVELGATYDALAAHLKCNPEAIEVRRYMFDSRIGWNTYIVTVGGEGVGFTNEEVIE